MWRGVNEACYRIMFDTAVAGDSCGCDEATRKKGERGERREILGRFCSSRTNPQCEVLDATIEVNGAQLWS